ncbi:hypothetical protein [Thalassobacillus devorans]|uniref:hypothetical protein n=1 Tax=Thalassobacillus devorans TaxID=279813 RepID=UPI000A1CA154|nr:hypothetical protein [Thalassobacillus devorans]
MKCKQVDAYNSKHFTITPISRILETQVNAMQIAYMHLAKKGVIGGHEATVSQMLLVVEGEGWVKGEDRNPVLIKKGQLAMWEPGEWHETYTEDGLAAINIESDQLEPFKALPLLSE